MITNKLPTAILHVTAQYQQLSASLITDHNITPHYNITLIRNYYLVAHISVNHWIWMTKSKVKIKTNDLFLKIVQQC